MATYKDIKRQIAELEKKAEELRIAEAARIIAGIKTQIIKYDLTPADLFDIGSTDTTTTPVAALPEKPLVVAKKALAKVGVKAPKPVSVPKYMDPTTLKTWTGHGKPPSWITAAAAEGKKDDFLIATVEAQRAEQAAKAAEKLSAAAVKKASKAEKPKAVATPTAKKPVIKAPAASTKKQVKPAAKHVPAPKKSVTQPKPTVAKHEVAVPEPVAVEVAAPTPETTGAPEANETV